MREVHIQEVGLPFASDLRDARLLKLLCLLFLFAYLTVPSAANAQNHTSKNVLILYSFSERSAFDPVESLETAIRSRVAEPVNFYVEYLESQRLVDPGFEKTQAAMLQNIYGKQKLDLVIVAAFPALRLALAHREELFPGTPIVFSYVDPARVQGKSWPGVTGVTAYVEPRHTIELALHLHPKTNTIAIVSNTSEFETYWFGKVHDELGHFPVKEVDLVGLPSGELLQRIADLPPQTVVLFQVAPQQSVQSAIGPYDLVAAIGKRLPTYCIFPVLCLNHGGIGGASGTDSDQTKLTAQQVSRVLTGERPEDLPVTHGVKSTVRVDWRELQRWHIAESALPPGTVVINREPSLWERDRNYIVAAIALIVAQFGLIIALLWQRARKRKAEAILRESEERFRRMADTTPSLIWMCDEQGEITYLNDKRLAFTGPNASAGYGNTWHAYLHPEDLAGALEANAHALISRTSFSKEYRLRRHDGLYRWMFDVASPRFNGDGSFAGFIGSAIDVTDQKLAQEALEKVSGRLIEAQEKERTRIARDLHDDICQRLVLLSMELEQANRDGAPTATKKRLEEIRQHCAEITGDVQSLSHQLHSSKLEYLGIVAAARGFCKEFAKQHKADIEFSDHNVPTDLPKEVSLCLFRVTQEALHNAVKYSGTRQYSVTLAGTDDEVRLVVRDRGAGFDVEKARNSRGLGLVSMQERASLVHGQFRVESKPRAGTTVTVAVPLATKSSKAPVQDAVDDTAMANGTL
jgi:PAS domain S-box-containing protein